MITDDWETSPDAMRWAPAPDHRDAPTGVTLDLALEEVTTTFAAVQDAARATLQAAADHMAEPVRQLRRAVEDAFAKVTRMPRRSDSVLVPSPHEWTRYTAGPQHQPRTRHRHGPNPRRLTVHHAPRRVGRRP